MNELNEFLPHNPEQTVTAFITLITALVLWIKKRKAEKKAK